MNPKFGHQSKNNCPAKKPLPAKNRQKLQKSHTNFKVRSTAKMFPCYCLHFITEQIPCAEMILNKRQRELLLEFKKFYKISWCSTQKWEMTLNGVCNKQEWEIASFDDDVNFYLPASLYSTQKFQLHIFELQISTTKNVSSQFFYIFF